MGIRRRSRTLSLAVAVAFSLVAVACGGGDDDDDSASTAAPSGDTAADAASGTTAATDPAETAAGAETANTTAATEPSDTADDAESPTDVDPAGILKFGNPLVSGIGVHLDPTQTSSDLPNIYWSELVYGTLLRFTEEGIPEPWMAEGVEIVDPQTVRITLRPDVTFTDGSAYDAEAVKTSLLRTRFESATPAIEGRMDAGFKSLASVDVIDPLTVEAHLDKPIASVFIDALASVPGTIQSPKQIAENPADIDLRPIGAGPYVFEEYIPDQKISLRKNPDFFDADHWLLGGIDVIHTPNGPTQANALLSDTIDFNTQVPVDSLQALDADDALTTDVLPVRLVMMLMCSTKPPFDNELVRQAVQVGIDREGYNELVYGGQGVPADGLFQDGDPSHDPQVAAQLAYDPDKARELLQESGVADPTFDLVTITTHNWGRQAEAIQSQLKEIGITANIVPMDDVYTNWIQPQAPGAMLVPVPGLRTGGYSMFNAQVVEGGAQAYCGSTGDPEVAGLITEAAGLAADDPESIDLFRQANQEYVDSALNIPVLFEPYANTWNTDRVGGTPKWIDVLGYGRPMFDTVYVKQS